MLEVGQNYEPTITNEGFEIGNECHSEILTSLKISEHQSEQICFIQTKIIQQKQVMISGVFIWWPWLRHQQPSG